MTVSSSRHCWAGVPCCNWLERAAACYRHGLEEASLLDTTQLTMLMVNVVGFAIILAELFALMWLSHTLYTMLDAKMETSFRRLSDALAESHRRPRQLDDSCLRLEAMTDARRFDTQPMMARPSEAELDQARLDGVNSVLASQTHSHESPGN